MSKELDERVKNKISKRGEIWLIKCDKIKEFSKDYRPGLVVSNDIQNEFSDYIAVAMLTTDDLENVQLFEVFIQNTPENGLTEPSKKGKIKNRNNPNFWGISSSYKILCLECIGRKFYNRLVDWQRKKFREYVRRGYV